MSQSTNFVTVVAVRTGEREGNKENINFDANSQGYVTVLTISDAENNNKTLKGITEEVIVYRLPGEKLGFGLKFEGGTKANEFVKRLFIQSCAADSPASRVQSSWGKLTEGDEVLEIDSIPVNTMTRIDCVRCLKDSNVAIKLLVRHLCENTLESKQSEGEEKRLPPVPPPVPPRKIHRKMLKNIQKETSTTETSQELEVTSHPMISAKPPKKLQHSRSMRAYYSSPDVHRRVRRFSDGNLGPPEAGVYTDLISQESTQSLSESDDTESTISTVIDKFGSVPNTTTSSFAGSLPSTPTSIQKKLDVSNLAVYDDEECVAPPRLPAKPVVQNKEENNNVVDGVDPLCFQDAPLSYGNESTSVLCINESDGVTEEPIKEEKHSKKPPVPPRARTTVLTTVDTASKDKKSENLPRLVDFVPKSANSPRDSPENSAEIMRLFLENERHKTNAIDFNPTENDNYRNGIDMYCSKWSLSFQLTTIGEVEEESGADPSNKPSIKTTPVVIVESADGNSEKQAFHNGTMNGVANKGYG
ncbi:unnamed protein product [Acanthoscelides obtectus]|uniref:PDZ domain-containing protein n=1 Tax=Acanthoscelides obtectus TaxID=200917 RepID=A0A9P0NTQ0_ACAOB|nr:unnamed protein product [Acanthoscelides obtectus]CAK1629010.1 hypothetical protein AOBTE_LOCUS5528 [Acanthoscelides obtectus]